jgi:hypothetical protein
MKRETLAESIGSLLADVVRTQSAFEAAKTALYLAKLEAQRGDDADRLEEHLIGAEFGDFRTDAEMSAHYGEGRK